MRQSPNPWPLMSALRQRLRAVRQDSEPPSLVDLDGDSPPQPGDGMVVVDDIGLVAEANARARALLHCALPSLPGLDFWDAVPEHIAELHQAATEQALQVNGRHAFIAHHQFADSWVQYSFVRQGTGCTVRLRDVASMQRLLRQLEDSERFNHLMFDVHPNALLVFEAESLQVRSVNQAAIDFYGIERDRFLTLGMPALFPDGEGAALLSLVQPGLDGAPVLRLCKQQKADGQVVLAELSCAPLRWNGRPCMLVGLADVSRRLLGDSVLRRINDDMEQALTARENELKKASRDLAAFTQAVSHDLQAPLHTVNGFARMLAEKYLPVLDEPGQHYVHRIQASTRQLSKFVDDLRTLVQLPQREGPVEPTDLAPLCRALIDELRKREPERHVTIEMESSLLLRCDRRVLESALACLLENAWKFTGKKAEAWIRVQLLPGKAPGEQILAVSDNGAGFDVAYASKLFTAFQRLHSSADFPGNGLGLAIVRRVAERHGGQTWAETAAQAGASFFMGFPQGAVLAPPAAMAAAPEDSQAALKR